MTFDGHSNVYSNLLESRSMDPPGGGPETNPGTSLFELPDQLCFLVSSGRVATYSSGKTMPQCRTDAKQKERKEADDKESGIGRISAELKHHRVFSWGDGHPDECWATISAVAGSPSTVTVQPG